MNEQQAPNKISLEEAHRFIASYLSGYASNPPCRPGQAFLNKYFPGVSDPKLYYCVDMEEAMTLIYLGYVDASDGGSLAG